MIAIGRATTAPCNSCLSFQGMRTGKDEQSATALPFRAQAGTSDRVRTGRYRATGNCQKECHEAEHSPPSPDELHKPLLRVRFAKLVCAFGRSLPQVVAASRSVNSAGLCRDDRSPRANMARLRELRLAREAQMARVVAVGNQSATTKRS